MFVVPLPCLGVDGLSDRAEDADRAQVVVCDVFGSETAQETDGGRGRVELSEFVFGHSLPVARGVGVDGG